MVSTTLKFNMSYTCIWKIIDFLIWVFSTSSGVPGTMLCYALLFFSFDQTKDTDPASKTSTENRQAFSLHSGAWSYSFLLPLKSLPLFFLMPVILQLETYSSGIKAESS